MMTMFGDIGARTAGYVVAELLKRGMPYMCLEKFGASKPLPANKTLSMLFRRYNHLPLATTPLQEGVTPASKKLVPTDITMTLAYYGDIIEISDAIADTHEDPVLQESENVLAEQAAKTIETVRYGVLKAGTNKFFANGTARTSVNTALALVKQRKVTRALARQNAELITSAVRSTVNFNTESVEASFIAIAHTDCKTDIRSVPQFINSKDYGTVTPYENEVGTIEDVRYLTSNLYTPYPDAGAAKGTMISTTGTSADVYPYIYIARNSYAISALKGKYAITPIVINPVPSKSDPMGRKGSVAWKTVQGCVILNDAWLGILEAAVVELV